MKASASKTVHVDKRPSFAGNLVTIFAGRAERTAESTTMRQNLPGKSHVGRILLNDNTSQERLLDIKLSDIHNAQKKTATFISHQKKTFITRMEHRQSTWVREHSRKATSLNALASSRKWDSVTNNEDAQNTEDGQEHTLNQVNPVDEVSEKHSQERTVALPEIAVRTRTKYKRGNGDNNTTERHLGSREGKAANLSLPALQGSKMTDKPTTSAEGTRLPSVLITSEAHTDFVHQDLILTTDEGASTSKKKPRRVAGNTLFEQPRLAGPSPTFISEILPRIQIKECAAVPGQHRRTKRHRMRKRSPTSTGDGNPLADDRFLKLQHTLAPSPRLAAIQRYGQPYRWIDRSKETRV